MKRFLLPILILCASASFAQTETPLGKSNGWTNSQGYFNHIGPFSVMMIDTASVNAYYAGLPTAKRLQMHKDGALAKQGRTYYGFDSAYCNCFVPLVPTSSGSYPTFSAPSGFTVTGSGTSAITLSAPGSSTTQYINGAGGASLVSGLPISTATQTALNAKQATLVSGTNIKTINSTSLLGSGDIAISGGGSIITDTSIYYIDTAGADASGVALTDSVFARAARSGKGTIKLGPGFYYKAGNTNVPANMNLLGSGVNRTFVSFKSSTGTNGFNANPLFTFIGDVSAFYTTSVISGITFLGSGGNFEVDGQSFLRFNNSWGWKISNCEFQNCSGDTTSGGAIEVSGTGSSFNGAWVTNCRFYNNRLAENLHRYAEFIFHDGDRYFANFIGTVNNGGNNLFNNCSWTESTYCNLMSRSNGIFDNPGHGGYTNCQFGHCPVWCVDIWNQVFGTDFVNCFFYGANTTGYMRFVNNIGLSISKGQMGAITDVWMYGNSLTSINIMDLPSQGKPTEHLISGDGWYKSLHFLSQNSNGTDSARALVFDGDFVKLQNSIQATLDTMATRAYARSVAGGGGGTNYWTLTGSDILNNNAGIVGIAGVLNIPTTSTTAGILTQNGSNLLHTWGGVWLGPTAGNLTHSGYANTGIGGGVMPSLTAGVQNTAMGNFAAHSITTGINNTVVGEEAGSALTTGSYNSILGQGAGVSLTTPNYNTMIGASAGALVSDGAGNMFLGASTGVANVHGGYNAAIGVHSLGGTTSDGNIGLGYYSGNTNTTGAYNIYIGYQADVTASNFDNVVVIGANTNASASNQFVLGASTHKVSVAGSFGVGTTTPDASASVDITSTTRGFLPPRMTTMQMNAISSPATGLMLYNSTAGVNYSYNGAAYKTPGVVSGSFSQAITAATSVTVTFGGTQPNSTYKVFIQPTSSLALAGTVANKTATTFDYVFSVGTGTVTFDYEIVQ